MKTKAKPQEGSLLAAAQFLAGSWFVVGQWPMMLGPFQTAERAIFAVSGFKAASGKIAKGCYMKKVRGRGTYFAMTGAYAAKLAGRGR